MKIIPITVEEAEAFLAKFERHYKSPARPICAIGIGEIATNTELEPEMKLHGAAILGRNSVEEAELAHIYVDGVSQGYSLLYGACWRALKALGYRSAVL